MLNSEFIHREAAAFAADLRKQAGDDVDAQVHTALWRVWQREPTAAEVARGVRLIDELQTQLTASPDAALQQFCVLALNLNEFMYVD